MKEYFYSDMELTLSVDASPREHARGRRETEVAESCFGDLVERELRPKVRRFRMRRPRVQL